MKFTAAALLALLTPVPSTLRAYLFAVASPSVDEHDSPGATAGGLRSSANRSTRKTSSVDPDYWIVPVKNVGLTCIDNSIRAGGDKDDDYKCITEGEALCITYDDQYFGGKWTFGVKDSMVKLWNPKMEVVWEFCTEVTHVCIGEEHGYDPNRYSEERPYLNFYNEKTHEVLGSLTCDGTDGKVCIRICIVSTGGHVLHPTSYMYNASPYFISNIYFRYFHTGRQEHRTSIDP